MRIATPLGEYPFEFRRVERRDGGVAVVGTVAGLESVVLLEPVDLAKLGAALALPAAAIGLLAFARGRR